MKLKQLGSNQTEVQTGRYNVLFSYETPVAVYDNDLNEYLVTSTKHSVTTSKHINAWLPSGNRHSEQQREQEFFDRLVTIS